MNKSFENSYSHVILLIALGLSVLACYVLLRPYLEPVIIAFLFALIFHPVHSRIEGRLGKRSNLAALVSCAALTFSIVLPTVFIFLAILRQGTVYSSDLYNWVNSGGLALLMSQEWVVDLLARLREWLPGDLFSAEKVAAQLMASASSVGKNILDLSARAAGGITGFLVSFLLMLFVLFFVLRDYERMFAFVRHALPLSRNQEDALLKEILDVSKSALLGSFLTALSQGIAGGIGLWLAGFPGLFWGTFMAFSSLIPVVGTALVWLPAAVYLLFTGDWGWGLFLIVWGVLVVGSIDNFLRPWFMQGSSSMNALIIFFSLLGGIHLYGLMGLLYGPVIFAVTLVLFRLYEQEFEEFLDYQDRH